MLRGDVFTEDFIEMWISNTSARSTTPYACVRIHTNSSFITTYKSQPNGGTGDSDGADKGPRRFFYCDTANFPTSRRRAKSGFRQQHRTTGPFYFGEPRRKHRLNPAGNMTIYVESRQRRLGNITVTNQWQAPIKHWAPNSRPIPNL